ITIFDTDRSGPLASPNSPASGNTLRTGRTSSSPLTATAAAASTARSCTTLAQFGYNLGSHLLVLVQKKYMLTTSAGHGAAPPGISFDRFVRACVVVKQLSESFGRLDTDRDGWIQINYDQFMETVLALP
ncbi:hypothetical protein DFH08DRAFT_848019, partial [Mycena albidolilacea]